MVYCEGHRPIHKRGVGVKKKKERQTGRQTDRQTDRQAETQSE